MPSVGLLEHTHISYRCRLVTGGSTKRPTIVSVSDRLRSPHNPAECDDAYEDCANVINPNPAMTSSPPRRTVAMTTTIRSSMTTNGSADDVIGNRAAAAVGGNDTSLIVGCVSTLAFVLLVVGAVAVYRYRRCYDGTYEIDAESSANGYVPTSLSSVGNGELRPMRQCRRNGSGKKNGSLRTKSETPDGHYPRPTRELYV